MTCQEELGPGRDRQGGATILLSTTSAMLPPVGARNAVREPKLTSHFPFNLYLKPLLHVHVSRGGGGESGEDRKSLGSENKGRKQKRADIWTGLCSVTNERPMNEL